ncbi:MAG: FlgD immunoglobulin-like domain containing protein [Elusimicrobiota bacterium]
MSSDKHLVNIRQIFSVQFLTCVLAGVLLGVFSAPAAAGKRKAPVRLSPLSDSLRKTGKVPDSAARDAFRGFTKKTGTDAWRVRYSPKTALPEAIVGAKTSRYPGTPAQAAIAFLNDNKDLLKVDVTQLRQAYSKVFMGVTHIQYEQIYNSIPVEFAYVRVHISPSGEVTGYQAKFEPDINVRLSPAFPASYAESAVLSDLGFSARITDRTLVLFPDQTADGALKLAWKIRARASDTASGVWLYYVGAEDGKILFRYNDLRYACPDNTKSTGTVKGSVYAISPAPTDTSRTITRESWTQPASNIPINNQYVWVTGDLSFPTKTTTAAGEYCSAAAGKVFASLKGPFFSVVNFRGPSAHFDNGGGLWRSVSTAVTSPIPYANSKTYDYAVTVPNDWSIQGQAFAKVMPHFTSFSVGEMGIDGTINDADQLNVKNGNDVVASYIGTRSQPFFGAAVENSSYGLSLETDEAGTFNGFSVDVSSYLVLANAPLVRNNATGSIVWSTGTPGVFMDSLLGGVENTLAEVNAFYHLNAAYDYFKLVNLGPGGPFADLSSNQVPVMVHAHGTADNIAEAGGMENAFYDLEKDNIFLGDGPMIDGSYRSFALDGTIIRHEYIHRVVNRIYPIINFGEFGAVSEAMADYFSLASFKQAGTLTPEGGVLNVLGNFVGGGGEGMARDLSGASKSMPTDWTGEVHDDSLILSQTLWQLKDMGSFSAISAFPNMPKADVFTYAALFYFPDNFANFYDAFVEACKLLDAGCTVKAQIDAAFTAHGIPAYSGAGDTYDQPVTGTLCDNNNGPECATDVSTMTALSATVYPAGDVDYYSIPLQEGNFTAVLSMPATANPDYYSPYTLFLIDADRNLVTYPDGSEALVTPTISNSYTDFCEDENCITDSSTVSLTYSITNPGRYYIGVSGALGMYSGNSRVASLLPYSLQLSYAPKGSASASMNTAKYDQDIISFTVPYTNFPVTVAPSSSTLTGAESVFAYAQLRDHNFQPIALARTDYTPASGRLLSVPSLPSKSSDHLGRPILSGTVSLNSGFALRYPGVGTVYLEVFGRNHMGSVMSLGVSNAINLTANKSDIIAYNNILTGTGDRALIKYELQTAGELTIKIYTVTGSLVKTLFSGGVSAGKGTIDWDGTNNNGAKVASGIYYIKGVGPGLDAVDKIAVVR